MTGDALHAAELFAVCVETNVEAEGMKAANVAARTINVQIPFGHEKFMLLLARHEARVDKVKGAAKARAARLTDDDLCERCRVSKATGTTEFCPDCEREIDTLGGRR